MTNFLSPEVIVREFDNSLRVPAVGSTAVGYVAPYQWGPVGEITTVTSENELVQTFGKPSRTDPVLASQWLTASSFLAYGSNLLNVRVVGDEAKNATDGTGILIKNTTHYDQQDELGNLPSDAQFIAKYPGSLGNSLAVAVCSYANNYSKTFTGTATSDFANLTGTVVFSANVLAEGLVYGDYISFNNANVPGKYNVTGISDTMLIKGITADSTSNARVMAASSNVRDIHSNQLFSVGDSIGIAAAASTYEVESISANGIEIAVTTSVPAVTDGSIWKVFADERVVTMTPNLNTATPDLTAATVTWNWKYYKSFVSAPGTSTYAANQGLTNDEMHVVVIDEDGSWSGTANTVLEKFEYVSSLPSAMGTDGASIYVKNVLNRSSNYIWYGGEGIARSSSASQVSLANGGDDNTVAATLNDRAQGYRLFEDPENVDVRALFLGNASYDLVQNVIDNVAEVRKDCVVYFSPEKSDVVGISSTSAMTDNVIDFATTVARSTSYAFMDSGYKKMYDIYNDVDVAVPLNGDTAGLLVQTGDDFELWFPPSGYTRGRIKNALSLYFNPNKTNRDDLYQASINPVISEQGQGIVLLGDKTFLSKPSSFDRINVRMLFIVVELAIAEAAKYTLFEVNDEQTRAAFRNLVEPYLDDIMGRRGMEDYRVICDLSNNTEEVRVQNRFVADIRIKPLYSINWVVLNFTNVRGDLDVTYTVA